MSNLEFDLEKWIRETSAYRGDSESAEYSTSIGNLICQETESKREAFNKALELIEQAFEREVDPDSWGHFAKPKVLEIINKLKSGGR